MTIKLTHAQASQQCFILFWKFQAVEGQLNLLRSLGGLGGVDKHRLQRFDLFAELLRQLVVFERHLAELLLEVGQRLRDALVAAKNTTHRATGAST